MATIYKTDLQLFPKKAQSEAKTLKNIAKRKQITSLINEARHSRSLKSGKTFMINTVLCVFYKKMIIFILFLNKRCIFAFETKPIFLDFVLNILCQRAQN
jgi:hypothetical protein